MDHRTIGAIALLTTLTLGAGCANTINGSIDGERVGTARDAIYDEVEVDVPFLGSMHLVYVTVTTVPNACEAYDEMMDIDWNGCDDYCDDLYDFATRYLGLDQYWNLTMALWPGGSVETEYDYGNDVDDEFTATISRWSVANLYDPAACEDECEDGDEPAPTENDDGEDGFIDIAKYEEKEMVKGSYEIDFGGSDVLKGNFNATYCDMGLDNWDIF